MPWVLNHSEILEALGASEEQLTSILAALSSEAREKVEAALAQKTPPVHVRNTMRKTTTEGATPLLLAVQRGQIDLVEQILTGGADIEEVGSPLMGGLTPLITAVEHGKNDIMELLLRSNADVNKGDDNIATPLFWAVYQGNVEAGKLLLEYKADIDKAHANGERPLTKAAGNAHVDFLKLLLSSGATVNALGFNGSETAYDCAFEVQRNASEPGEQERAREAVTILEEAGGHRLTEDQWYTC